MPSLATLTVAVSAILLLLGIIWGQYRSPNWLKLILHLIALALYLLLLRFLFGFPALDTGYSKGASDGGFLALALAMYVCMLAGMAAEYVYHYFDAPRSKPRKFEIGTFVKPFLVSPLVFMPLAGSLQSANLDLSHFDAPRLMVFLVAFENGFLWRGYFSRKLAESQRTTRQGRQG
jgi:hypothetical protein